MMDLTPLVYLVVFLVNLLCSDVITKEDLTTAEESVRGQIFDTANETATCKVMGKIKLEDFEALANSFVRQWKFPDFVLAGILQSVHIGTNMEASSHFGFNKSETGRFTYQIIAAVKLDDDTINLEIAVFYLEFKLTPQRYKVTMWKTILGIIPIGKKVWLETVERDVSARELELMSIYVKEKARTTLKEMCDSFPESYVSNRMSI